MDETEAKLPELRSTIFGRNALAIQRWAITFTWKVSSFLASAVSRKRVPDTTPALLTTTSG
jgi:hypothetical protein